jgi:hypothetical protein
MESKYWATRFNGARRVETQDSNAVAALAPQS